MSAESIALTAIGLSLVAVLYAFVATRQVDNKVHIESVQSELTKSIAALRLRMDMAETQLRSVPEAAVLTDLRVKLGSMEANYEALMRELHRMGASTARIEDYLLKAKQ